MKKIIVILSLFLFSLAGYSQLTDVGEMRIADATTAIGRNIPVGTKVYNIDDGKYWVAIAAVHADSTLTTAAAMFTQLNSSGTDDQTASEVDITDAGGYYTGTEVETALQEVGSDLSDLNDSIAQHRTEIDANLDSINIHRTAIDLNTAKETNVSTTLEAGTVDGTSYGITSDGGADDIVLPAATTDDAGLMTATQYDKLDGIEASAEVNYTLITESFEETSGTPTSHNLAQTAITANGCRVSINGATLDPADYTLTTSTITLDGPVLEYDKVVITYSY